MQHYLNWLCKHIRIKKKDCLGWFFLMNLNLEEYNPENVNQFTQNFYTGSLY